MDQTNKTAIRGVFLNKLKHHSHEARRQKSEAIRRSLLRLAAFRRAATVCCYVALPYEVQTWKLIEDMIAKGKRVVVPLADRGTRRMRVCEIKEPHKDLAPGAYGVWEPVRGKRRGFPVGKIDLMCVPGLAFDRQGNRLGHGLGYFDRFLRRLPKRATTVGLAFDFQLLDHLPTEAHDQAVQRVLTA